MRAWGPVLLLAIVATPITGVALGQQAPLSWGPTRAVSPNEAADVEALLRAQMNALRSGDGAAAYAAAAPEVRRKFPTVAAFMTMVGSAYSPLRGGRGARIGPVRGAAGTPTHGATYGASVDVADAAGQAWTAEFGVERQPDGTLKITSCVLIPRPAGSA